MLKNNFQIKAHILTQLFIISKVRSRTGRADLVGFKKVCLGYKIIVGVQRYWDYLKKIIKK